MTKEATKKVIDAFYDNLLVKQDKNELVNLFAEEVDWDIPGDTTLFPILRKRSTKQQVASFFKDEFKDYAQPISFDIEHQFIDAGKAVVVGHLVSRMLPSNAVYESDFSVYFVIKDGLIVYYRFLEDSHKLVKTVTEHIKEAK